MSLTDRLHTLRFRPMVGALAAVLLVGGASPAFAAWETPGVATTAMAEQTPPAPQVTVSAPVTAQAMPHEAFYKVTAADVGSAVAEQLKIQAVESQAEIILAPGSPSTLYTSDRPVKVAIHTLQVDTKAKRWQAQAYFIADGKTESVIPVSGTYGAMVDVPVVTRQFAKTDVIAQNDIEIRAFPERLLRKDTITDSKALIGLSPRQGISPGRPIHTNEIAQPTVIKKGDLVEMGFNTPYIHIKTAGIALQDGAKGDAIRVKNQKSERAVSAKVIAAGKVEVSNDVAM